MKPSLGLTLGTQLALTPALQQSIRLLQLSSLELAQEISTALEDNPFLERDFDPDLDPQRFESSGAWDVGVGFAEDASGEVGAGSDSQGLADQFDSARAAQEFAEYGAGLGAGLSEGEGEATHTTEALSWEGDGSHSGAEFEAGSGLGTGADSTEWGCDAPASGMDRASGSGSAGSPGSAEHATSREAWTSLAPQNLYELLLRQIGPCIRAHTLNGGDAHQNAALQAVLEFVAGCVDGRGFLVETAAELALAWHSQNPAEAENHPLALFETAVGLLQSLEPAGVGARDALHCVALQLARQELEGDYRPRELPALQLAQQLCALPLAVLARRDFKAWAKRFETDEALVRSGYERLRSCSPEPPLAEALQDWNADSVCSGGSGLGSVSGSGLQSPAGAAGHALRPDITVQLLRGKGLQLWQARLVADPQLSVKVSRQAQWLKLAEAKTAPSAQKSALSRPKKTGSTAPAAPETAAEGLAEKVQNARWWVRSLQQRNESLLRVAQAVVDVQQAYFSRGAVALRPLVLRQIAEATQLHESTVSRLTTGKYIATPHGVKELKFFFAASLAVTSATALKNSEAAGGSTGHASNLSHSGSADFGHAHFGSSTQTLQATSSTAVKSHIAALIAAEPAAKPLSDEKISQALAAQGIECARRTVAKYREELNLLPASARRSR